jgi:DNA-3-methyladenine glycosylase II
MSAAVAAAREQQFTLDLLGPFSLRAAARFWGGFTPGGHAGLDQQEHLHMAFAVEGKWATAGVCLRELDGHLVGRVSGDAEPDVVRQQIARILSLDVDGREFPAIGRRDRVAADLQERYPGLRPVCFYSAYEAAVWAIISQRMQMRQAAAIKARLAESFGDVADIHGENLRAFPGPRRLIALQSFAGLPDTKIARLRAVSEAAIDAKLDSAHLRSLADDQAMAELQSLSGIGPFSAELILLRGAGHPDYLTFVEPRFRRAVAAAYGFDHLPTDDELRSIAANWRPYRTWMTFLLRQDFAE